MKLQNIALFNAILRNLHFDKSLLKKHCTKIIKDVKREIEIEI